MVVAISITAKQKYRQFWLAMHLYLGLSVGLVFSIVGLTGSCLVFYLDLDQWLNPELVVPKLSASRLSYEALFQTLLRAEPDRRNGWRLEIPPDNNTAIMARYYLPEETKQHGFAPLMVALDPGSGVILAKRFWGEFIMTWLYDLHYALLLDNTGKLLLASCGVLLLVSLLSGLYLWWPPRHKLKIALTLKQNASPHRLNYDLHKLAGVYSFIVLLVLTLTGIALEVPQYVEPVFNYFSKLQKPLKPKSMLPTSGVTRISVDQAVLVATKEFPTARLCWIETPADNKGSYRINFRQDFEPSQRFPKTNVWVDQYSGKVLAVSNPADMGRSDKIIHWFHPLHSGEAFGLTGRILVLISGLLCPVLFITGCIRWQQKRWAASNAKWRKK